MKKQLSIILAILTFFSTLPFAAVAAEDMGDPTPISISAVAERDLIENLDGYSETDDEGNKHFRYDVWRAELLITVKFSDDTEKNYRLNEANEDNFEFAFGVLQPSPEKEGIYVSRISLLEPELSCEVEIRVVENPIKEISAEITGKNSIVKKSHGQNVTENGEKWYRYSGYGGIFNVLKPTITIVYKDENIPSKTVEYYNWGSLWNETGYGISDDVFAMQSYENQWDVGEHSCNISYMGVSCELSFSITEAMPLKGIRVSPTKAITAANSQKMWDNNGNEYDYYNPDLSEPEITLVFKDGEETFDYGNLYNLEQKYGFTTEYKTDQDARNVWKAGEKYKVKLIIGECSADFEVEIISDPVEWISARATRTIIEKTGGYEQNGIYYYSLYGAGIEVSVKLRDEEAPRTYSANELYRIPQDFGEELRYFYVDYTNGWEVGTHRAKVMLFSHTAEFDVEIVKCPVKELIVKPKGNFYVGIGTYESNGKIIYNPSYIGYDITVIYENGLTKSSDILSDFMDDGYYIDFNTQDQYENQWTEPGEYTIRASYMGKETSVKVRLEEVPYQKIRIREESKSLVVTLTDKKGIPTDYTVKGIEAYLGDSGMLGGALITDKGKLENVEISWQVDEIGTGNGSRKDVYGKNFKISCLGLTSNTIDSEWFEAYMRLSAFSYNYISVNQENKNAAFRGRVTADKIDSMLSVAAFSDTDFLADCESSGKTYSDEADFYLCPSLNEASALLRKYYGEANIDLTFSKYYDSENGTVKIKNYYSDYDIGSETCTYDSVNNEWVFRKENGVTVTQSYGTTDIKVGFIGDTELNSSIDIIDLIRLKKATASSDTEYNAFLDINGDGNIDATDVAALRRLLFNGGARTKGDINGDGTVNSEDFAELRDLIFEETDAYYVPYADINGDGVIDEKDYSALRELKNAYVKKNT